MNVRNIVFYVIIKYDQILLTIISNDRFLVALNNIDNYKNKHYNTNLHIYII